MLTFLHGADFHLDSLFRSLPPEQAMERRQEQRQLLTRLVDTAHQERADLIFLSGDLFDGQRARPETIQALYQALEELDAQVFLSPGNHDPFTRSSPYARLSWPDHVHIFSSPTPERMVLPQLGCVVYGSAFTSTSRLDSPLDLFHPREEPEGTLTFGCFHGELNLPSSRYGPIAREQIAASGLDYLALGHIHTASGLKREGHTYYAWPGCLEGRGFDETGEKGIYAGTFDDNGLSLRFLPLSRRRYLVPRLDISQTDAEQALAQLIAQSHPEDIVRILLVGDRPEETPPNLTQLSAIARSHFYSASIFDRTSLSQSLWARQGEDTLVGIFLRTMHHRLEEASAEDRPLLERAVRFGLAALERREEPR